MIKSRFIDDAVNYALGPWSGEPFGGIEGIGELRQLFGDRQDLIVGDLLIRWMRWYLDGTVDPQLVAEENIQYAFLYSEVKSAIESQALAVGQSESSILEITKIIANAILDTAISLRKSRERQRQRLSYSGRRLLLDIAAPSPSCWICGLKFSQESIDEFLEPQGRSLELPDFVDILAPRGLKSQDLRIEVDHVIPFSLGGGDEGNQRLSCGWCNRYKGAHVSLYDVNADSIKSGNNALRLRSLPPRFWIVRMLAYRRRCEGSDSCNYTRDDGRLYVSPIRDVGSMNPSNLRLVCLDHDTFREKRWQSQRTAREVWGGT